MEEFKKELSELLAKHDADMNTNTPCDILAESLLNSLVAIESAINGRVDYYNKLSDAIDKDQ